MNPLPTLLHYANAAPPWQLRYEFYSLKSRLLKRYATPDGCDVQHIPGKECWTCDGTGLYSDYSECRKCWGTGWYREPRWICLDRYKWGQYVFHVPGAVSYTKPEPDVTRIVGRIQHESYGRKCDEAFGWLCLLTGEWRLFWDWFWSSGYYVGLSWYPLVATKTIIGRTANFYREWTRRCPDCKRWIGRTHSTWCDECDQKHRTVGDEIPF